MTRCIAFLIALALAVPAFAAETIEARMKELVLRAADGSIGSIQSEVTPPGSFGARTLQDQIVLHHGTAAVLAQIAMGDASPLKKTVPAATWSALLAAQPVMESVRSTMNTELRGTVQTSLAKRDLLPTRVLVGVANIHLRLLNEEAETPLARTTHASVALISATEPARPEVHRAVLALASDPAATPEVRERAKHLYPLISQTVSAAAVAVAEHLGR
jgi:hypothetical protein